MKRADEEGELKDYEKFIDLIDLKEIIESEWPLFGDIFSINAKSSDSKSKKLAWFTKLNNIRKHVAHSIKPKGVTSEDLDYVRMIYDVLKPRLCSQQSIIQ